MAMTEDGAHARRFVLEMIEKYTERRDWELVAALFMDLGGMLEEGFVTLDKVSPGKGVYLKHTHCGEVFDDMVIASMHMLMAGVDDSSDQDCRDENEWELIPEEEAF